MKKLENLPNVSAPTAEFPYGDVNDNTGTNNGTPLNRASMSDMFQFFAKLADEAGVVPNDVVDNEYDGFQLYEAFRLLTRTYKVYSGFIVQNGTNDPVVTVLRNEIGNIAWTRIGVGLYQGNLVGMFPDTNKVMSFIGSTVSDSFYSTLVFSNDVLRVATKDSAAVSTDSLLLGTSIEIRVYD